MERSESRLYTRTTFAHTLHNRASSIADPAEKLRFLRQNVHLEAIPSPARGRKIAGMAVCGCLIAGVAFALHPRPRPSTQLASSTAAPAAKTSTQPAPVWLVEQKPGTEFYSNGLRIETAEFVSTAPRQYAAMRRKDGAFEKRSGPAGIVYHTTESRLDPFDPDHNGVLKSTSTALLSYARRNALYHFVIDRFGRVFRTVAEDDYANHAGHSIWADDQFAYLDLNHAFIGISFEAQTGALQSEPVASQVTAARMLTEMLRSKYGIAGENCVTHAQVSVNPDNMQLGYHTDWATSFPFRDLGLRNTYNEPNPAVVLFGFGYGEDLIQALGGKPWPGLVISEEQLVREAAAAGKTTENYRKLLRQKYSSSLTAARAAARERTNNEI